VLCSLHQAFCWRFVSQNSLFLLLLFVVLELDIYSFHMLSIEASGFLRCLTLEILDVLLVSRSFVARGLCNGAGLGVC
jgi:hypothetical protein